MLRAGSARYPLASVLAFGVTATLCGYKSYGAMGKWGRNYGSDLAFVDIGVLRTAVIMFMLA